ncbi:MAG: LacI family DNA-binding transcriptional regulator [Pseudomonadales bacterium]
MTSIKDVARMAGVSTATVSRTLAEPDKVAEKTRKKVLATVEKSGYVANSLARNFRRKRTNMVVVIVPDITNSFFSNIIQGIEAVAHANAYRILLGDTQHSATRAIEYGDFVAQKQADGIIVLGRSIPFPYQQERKTLDPKWPPFVMACEYDEVAPVPTVCIDNKQAAFDAVMYLINLGHRCIAYINGPADSPLCRDRLSGFRKAMKTIGITNTRNQVYGGDFSLKSGSSAMSEIMDSAHERPTAVFAASDSMAIGALQVIKASGLSVPGDISLMGFDDIKFSAYSDPALTTVHQPRNRIGETAMQRMLDLLERRDVSSEHEILPHRLVIRASAAAPS